MRERCLVVFIALMLITACSAQQNPAVGVDRPATLAVSESMQGTLLTVKTAAPNCLGDAISPIGQSIADDYESASYDQIMTWFCNGAEFKDILVALETESQTETLAVEMLQMLADGFTWEEIWIVTGLVD